jgi:branched-chain amino acid transport system permease protein
VAKTGLSPFAGIAVAAAGCAVAGVPIFLLLRRLAGGYFAVATWVVAECLFLYVTNQLWLGGGTGAGLQQLSAMAPVLRNAYTYWTALGLMTVIVTGVYLLVRSRFGLDSRAVHDEPAAAAAMGVEVQRTRWVAYLLAAAGFGAVGGMLIISTLYIDPAGAFNVGYSADMLFMVVIGGLGTLVGPIGGAFLIYIASEFLRDFGGYQLVVFALLVILVARFFRAGLWGLLRTGYQRFTARASEAPAE